MPVCACGKPTKTSTRCRACAAIQHHSRRQPLDAELPFLSPSIDPLVKAKLTVSSDQKVPVVCGRCQTERVVTFFSVYRQWKSRGVYVCRSCVAKDNGQLASKGLEKRRQTNLQRFGVEHPMQLPENRDRIRGHYAVYVGEHGHPMHDPSILERHRQTMMVKYGAPHNYARPEVAEKFREWIEQRTSSGEQEVREYLQSITNSLWPANWSVINPKQIDCFNPAYRMGVEYCGSIWHSEKMHKTTKSHWEKWTQCVENGIELITLFDVEWQTRRSQIESFLSARLGIYRERLHARKMHVDEMSWVDAVPYVNAWHIQPITHMNRGGRAWALRDGQQRVVSVMIFDRHHRRTAVNEMVLSRFVGAPGVQVVGGASRLLAAACQTFKAQNISRIVSWSDNRWTQGQVYARMGFALEELLPPDYWYVHLSTNTWRSKQSSQKRYIQCAPCQTERERMIELGYSRIWDCGKKRWILRM